MNYVIKNYKNVYIKLNENGKAVTCAEQDRTLFEYSKAKNIVGSLPRTLKKLKFKVEPVSDIPLKVNKEIIGTIKKEITKKEDYELSENVSRWIENLALVQMFLRRRGQESNY